MSVRIKIFLVSLFAGLPWLIAAGMAFWMVYETTDPRAAEIGRNVQLSLMGGLALVGLIGVIVGWLCLSLNRRTLSSWWATRFSLWIILGLLIAMAGRSLSGQQVTLGDPGAATLERTLLMLGAAVVVNLICMSFIEGNRPVFDRTSSRARA